MQMSLLDALRVAVNQEERNDRRHFNTDLINLLRFLHSVDVGAIIDAIVDDLVGSNQAAQVGFLIPELELVWLLFGLGLPEDESFFLLNDLQMAFNFLNLGIALACGNPSNLNHSSPCVLHRFQDVSIDLVVLKSNIHGICIQRANPSSVPDVHCDFDVLKLVLRSS